MIPRPTPIDVGAGVLLKKNGVGRGVTGEEKRWLLTVDFTSGSVQPIWAQIARSPLFSVISKRSLGVCPRS